MNKIVTLAPSALHRVSRLHALAWAKAGSLVTLAFVLAFSLQPSAFAQLTGTFCSNCLPSPVTCQTTASNLLASQYFTNRIWQGRHLGIGLSFVGGSTTNTGVIGFQFGVVINGTNSLKTTTKPFTFTSSVNGTSPVVDWAVLPNYTLGPADSIVLLGITNAAANVNPVAAGSVTVNSVWIQTDTRP